MTTLGIFIILCCAALYVLDPVLERATTQYDGSGSGSSSATNPFDAVGLQSLIEIQKDIQKSAKK